MNNFINNLMKYFEYSGRVYEWYGLWIQDYLDCKILLELFYVIGSFFPEVFKFFHFEKVEKF